MKHWRRVAWLELKNLFAGRAVAAGFLALFVAGGYGIYSGQTAISRQRAVLDESQALYEEHRDYVLSLSQREAPAGDLLYYMFLHTHHEPSDWAAFSLGGRDVHPYNLKVRLLTLEGQLYDSELTNPVALFYGNFDAAFVVVGLLPLLIIALTYGLVSDEEESGTWSLVRSQGASLASVLAVKLGVRIVSVLSLVLGLVLLAALAFGAPMAPALWTTAIAVVYVLLWFAACLLVVSLRRTSSFNAVALLAVWLVWTVVGPSLANVMLATALPVPEALEVTVRQRQGYHGSWDRPQAEVMANFYESYPDYADYEVPDDRYSNGWYYAMNQMGDDAARELSTAYRSTLSKRLESTDWIAPLFPPVLAQRALNELSRTDLESHLLYLESVRSYHEELKSFFFPAVFQETPVEGVAWEDAPRHWHSDRAAAVPAPLASVVVLFGVAGALFTAALVQFGRRRNLS